MIQLGTKHDDSQKRNIREVKRDWNRSGKSLSLKMLQTLWPENTWDLHNLKNLGQIIAEDLCQFISQAFQISSSFSFPIVSALPPAPAISAISVARFTAQRVKVIWGLLPKASARSYKTEGPESLQFLKLDETLSHENHKKKTNKKGASMNSRFFIASASAWICDLWAAGPGRSKTWNNESSSINTVPPQKDKQNHVLEEDTGHDKLAILWTLWCLQYGVAALWQTITQNPSSDPLWPYHEHTPESKLSKRKQLFFDVLQIKLLLHPFPFAVHLVCQPMFINSFPSACVTYKSGEYSI